MVTRKSLIKSLNNDIDATEKKINGAKHYKFKSAISTILCGAGIGMDHALPFILAASCVMYFRYLGGNMPFKVDKVMDKAYIQTIDTSDGKHIEYLSYDDDYDDEIFEYSTGWVPTTNGTFKREITTYILNDEYDISDLDKLLSLSKEEADKIFQLYNIKTIEKRKLDAEDFLYNNDCFIVIDNQSSIDKAVLRDESLGENIINIIFYLLSTTAFGFGFDLIIKKITRRRIRDGLVSKFQNIKHLSEAEVDDLKLLLELKKQNLAMFSEDVDDNDSKENQFTYKLRKKINGEEGI